MPGEISLASNGIPFMEAIGYRTLDSNNYFNL